jgi:hypothetical protein
MSHSVFSSGRGEGVQSRDPTPYDAITESRVPITANAPGNALSALARSSTARTVSRSVAIVCALGPRDVPALELGGCDDVAETVAVLAAQPRTSTDAAIAELR